MGAIEQDEWDLQRRHDEEDARDDAIERIAEGELYHLIDGLSVGETLAAMTDIELGALAEFIADADDCSAGYMIRYLVRNNLWASARMSAKMHIGRDPHGYFVDEREAGDA